MNANLHRPYKKISNYPLVKLYYAWNTISIDVVDPLPVSIGRAKYMIVALMVLPNGWKLALLANYMILLPLNSSD